MTVSFLPSLAQRTHRICEVIHLNDRRELLELSRENVAVVAVVVDLRRDPLENPNTTSAGGTPPDAA